MAAAGGPAGRGGATGSSMGGVGGASTMGFGHMMPNECLVYVNTLEACSKFAVRLREFLERDASAAFGGAGHDAERVMSCLQGLGSTGALFGRAASDCLEEVRIWGGGRRAEGRGESGGTRRCPSQTHQQ